MRAILLNIIFLISLLFSNIVNSQNIEYINLGINGLTCSQCSRSVEMQLKKLPFIQSIEMDLAGTQAILKIDERKNVNIYSIAQAVKDGGFSTRSIDIHFDESPFKNNVCYTNVSLNLYTKEKNNSKVYRAWGPQFMNRKDFRSQTLSPNPCPQKKIIFLLPINEIIP